MPDSYLGVIKELPNPDYLIVEYIVDLPVGPKKRHVLVKVL